MIRLVLADDHRMILEGLEQLFKREADFEVVGTATNGEEAVAAVKRHRPDILVLDVNMPRGNGMWVVRQLQPLHLPTQVVLLTDRKSTRLNSSHLVISYAVFCLKKKKANHRRPTAVR